ncbi:MAG: hypothetical protein AAFV53_05800 [Myxococcota bacterium]
MRGQLPLEDPETGARSPHPMRFVIVYSSTLAQTFDNQLPKRLDKQRRALERACRKATKATYACHADAQAAMADAPQGEWLYVEWSVVQEEVALPYARGPPDEGPEATDEGHVSIRAYGDLSES